jgi:hypothetical protein
VVKVKRRAVRKRIWKRITAKASPISKRISVMRLKGGGVSKEEQRICEDASD